jgi:hypothetical protein
MLNSGDDGRAFIFTYLRHIKVAQAQLSHGRLLIALIMVNTHNENAIRHVFSWSTLKFIEVARVKCPSVVPRAAPQFVLCYSRPQK